MIRRAKRHKKFDLCVERLHGMFPDLRAVELVKGAIWSITRTPEQDGVEIADIGIWQARLIPSSPPPPELLLFYSFNDTLVHFLTITIPSVPDFMSF
jgi:hypothetical protein